MADNVSRVLDFIHLIRDQDKWAESCECRHWAMGDGVAQFLLKDIGVSTIEDLACNKKYHHHPACIHYGSLTPFNTIPILDKLARMCRMSRDHVIYEELSTFVAERERIIWEEKASAMKKETK